MKRAHIFLFRLGGGGAETMLASLSRYYKNIACTFVVFERIQNETPFKGEILNLDTKRYSNKIIKNWLSFVRVFNTLRTEKPELIITCLQYINLITLTSVWILRRFGQLLNTKVVTRIASSNELTSKTLISKLLKPLLKIPDEFIVISKGLEKDLIEKYNIPKSKISFIPNSVELENYKTNEYATTQKEFDICTIGRYTRAKDHASLINAIDILRKKYGLSIKACIVGYGELQDELRLQVDSLGLTDSIELTGQIPYNDGQEKLKKSKIFVLSSRWEGFGIVLLEAMRCGLPIISTNCNYGPAEILDNGKYGILVPIENSEHLAKEIFDLLNNNARLSTLSKLSFKRVQDYDISVISKQYEEVLIR